MIEHVVALAVLAMVVVSVFTLLSVAYLVEGPAQDQSLGYEFRPAPVGRGESRRR